jgi:hypothetical protein
MGPTIHTIPSARPTNDIPPHDKSPQQRHHAPMHPLNPLVSLKVAFASVCVAVLFVGAAHPAAGQEKRVEITGGRDPSGQTYRWKVTNHSDSAIVRVEFPHFKADTWEVPPNWSQEATNLHGHTGTTGTSGVCVAYTDDTFAKLRKGDSAEFGMRTGRGLSNPGTGAVTVYFEDKTQARIRGVEVPSAPSLFERYLWIIGFGLILVAFVWMGVRQRRRLAADSVSAPKGAGESLKGD